MLLLCLEVCVCFFELLQAGAGLAQVVFGTSELVLGGLEVYFDCVELLVCCVGQQCVLFDHCLLVGIQFFAEFELQLQSHHLIPQLLIVILADFHFTFDIVSLFILPGYLALHQPDLIIGLQPILILSDLSLQLRLLISQFLLKPLHFLASLLLQLPLDILIPNRQLLQLFHLLNPIVNIKKFLISLLKLFLKLAILVGQLNKFGIFAEFLIGFFEFALVMDVLCFVVCVVFAAQFESFAFEVF